MTIDEALAEVAVGWQPTGECGRTLAAEVERLRAANAELRAATLKHFERLKAFYVPKDAYDKLEAKLAWFEEREQAVRKDAEFCDDQVGSDVFEWERTHSKPGGPKLEGA